jgi:hypothetical protein
LTRAPQKTANERKVFCPNAEHGDRRREKLEERMIRRVFGVLGVTTAALPRLVTSTSAQAGVQVYLTRFRDGTPEVIVDRDDPGGNKHVGCTER